MLQDRKKGVMAQRLKGKMVYDTRHTTNDKRKKVS